MGRGSWLAESRHHCMYVNAAQRRRCSALPAVPASPTACPCPTGCLALPTTPPCPTRVVIVDRRHLGAVAHAVLVPQELHLPGGACMGTIGSVVSHSHEKKALQGSLQTRDRGCAKQTMRQAFNCVCTKACTRRVGTTWSVHRNLRSSPSLPQHFPLHSLSVSLVRSP